MSNKVDHARSESSPAQLALLIAIVLLNFGLRLGFAGQVDLFVDEYTSMLAMESVADRGIPFLPSGLIYSPKGLLHSYLGGAVIGTLGPSGFLIRFVSVLASVITACCVYRLGRDWFSPAVGVMATAALTSLPLAIEWGTRIRPYALLQMLSLIGGYLALNAYVRDKGPRQGAAAFLVVTAS